MQDPDTDLIVAQEVLVRLDALAEKLGVTVDYLWSVMVKQGTVEGIYGIISMIFGIGLLYLGYFTSNRDWHNMPYDVRGAYTWALVLTTVCGLIFFVAGYFSLGYLFNPEYFAVQQLGAMLKGN